MTTRKPCWLERVLKVTGLDLFPIVFHEPNWHEAKSPYPNNEKKVRERLGDLTDSKKILEAVEYCSNLLRREEDRIGKIESKAFTIMSVTGVASGLITAFATFLLSLSAPILTIVLAVLFGCTVIAVTMTLILSFKVNQVGHYKTSYPDPQIVFMLKDNNLESVQLEHAVSLFQSFAQNQGVANRKATYLIGAQVWFRNSILLMLLIGLSLAVYIPFKDSARTSPRRSAPKLQRSLFTARLVPRAAQDLQILHLPQASTANTGLPASE